MSAETQPTKKEEKPCKAYERSTCRDGREHCFNCARHLDPVTQRCPRHCGEGNEAADDAANNEE